MLKKCANFILFNTQWPLCVVGAANGVLWPALAWTALYAGWHSMTVNRIKGDGLLCLLCLGIGLSLDTLWIRWGFLEFAHNQPWPDVAPWWIGALWVGLALALNHSLAWMQRWPVLCGIGFALLAPLSYAMAARIGAVVWLAPWWQVTTVITLSWALLIPLLLMLAKRWRQGARARFWRTQGDWA